MLSLKKCVCLSLFLPLVLIVPLVSAQKTTATPLAACGAAAVTPVPVTAAATTSRPPTLTPSPAPTATPDVAREPLSATEIEPFDLRFNPNPEKPFAVVMNFTLTLQNNLPQDLEVKNPSFELMLDGVAWGELASTDFRMGRIQAQRPHGIVLQTLLMMKNATDEQKAVLACVQRGAAVDVRVFGTIIVSPGGQDMTLDLDISAEDLVLPTRH